MSFLSSLPGNDAQNTPDYSLPKKLKLSIPKILLPILLVICTGGLFYQTWYVQQTCHPMVGSGNMNCPIKSITLKPNALVLNQEEPRLVTANFDLENLKGREVPSANKTLRWESSDPRIFSVEAVGSDNSKSNSEQREIVGHQPGEATLKVSSKRDPERSTSTKVTTSGVKSVAINPDHLNLQVKNKANLEASVTAFGKASGEIIWSSRDEAVATVDKKGRVKTTGEGRTTIVATSKSDPDKIATATIAVRPIVIDSINLQAESSQIQKGETLQLTVSITGDGANSDQVSWKSSNRKIARIDGRGSKVMLRALKEGDVAITATSEQDTNKYETLTFIVQPSRVEQIKIQAIPPKIWQGDRQELAAEVRCGSANCDQVSWASDNEDVARVDAQDAQAVLEALKPGKATITAVSDLDSDQYDRLAISISPPEITGISFPSKQDKLQLNPQESGQLCAWVEGHGAYDPSKSWTSSDSDVVSVDESGFLTAMKRGKATVTATSTADPSQSAAILVEIPRDLSWVAIAAGGIVAVGCMVILPPPVAITMGAGAVFIVNQWTGSGFPGC